MQHVFYMALICSCLICYFAVLTKKDRNVVNDFRLKNKAKGLFAPNEGKVGFVYGFFCVFFRMSS
jgi:hypothetical protein